MDAGVVRPKPSPKVGPAPSPKNGPLDGPMDGAKTSPKASTKASTLVAPAESAKKGRASGAKRSGAKRPAERPAGKAAKRKRRESGGSAAAAAAAAPEGGEEEDEEEESEESEEDDDSEDESEESSESGARKRRRRSGTARGSAPAAKRAAAATGAEKKVQKRDPNHKFDDTDAVNSRKEAATHRQPSTMMVEPTGFTACEDLANILAHRSVQRLVDLKRCFEKPALQNDGHPEGRPLRIGTACSGTEAPILAMEMITAALRAMQLPEIRWEHVFSCEKEQFKAAYIARNFARVPFDDITTLCSDTGKAKTSWGAEREVPGCDIFVAGTVCKDFSGLRRNQKTIEDQGQSGNTFFAAIDYLFKFRPSLAIFENVQKAPWAQMENYINGEVVVDKAAEQKELHKMKFSVENEAGRLVIAVTSCPKDIGVRGAARLLGVRRNGTTTVLSVTAETEWKSPLTATQLLKKLGHADLREGDVLVFDTAGQFRAKHMLLDTKQYGLPQTRTRGYMLVWRLDYGESGVRGDKIGERWVELMKQLRDYCMISVDDFLYSDDHPRVARWRSQLRGPAGQKEAGDLAQQGYWWQGGSMDRYRNGAQRSDRGHRQEARPVTSWHGGGKLSVVSNFWPEYARLLNPRQQDVADIALLEAATEPTCPRDLQHAVYVLDLSQNVDRQSSLYSAPGVTGCLTPGGWNWVTNRGRAMLGFEKLLLQGIPAERLNLAQESEVELSDLAGNAMSVPVIGNAILAALAAGIDAPTRLPRLGHLMPLTGAPQRAIPTGVPLTEAAALAPRAEASSVLCPSETSGEYTEGGLQACTLTGCRMSTAFIQQKVYNVNGHDFRPYELQAPRTGFEDFKRELARSTPPLLRLTTPGHEPLVLRRMRLSPGVAHWTVKYDAVTENRTASATLRVGNLSDGLPRKGALGLDVHACIRTKGAVSEPLLLRASVSLAARSQSSPRAKRPRPEQELRWERRQADETIKVQVTGEGETYCFTAEVGARASNALKKHWPMKITIAELPGRQGPVVLWRKPHSDQQAPPYGTRVWQKAIAGINQGALWSTEPPKDSDAQEQEERLFLICVPRVDRHRRDTWTLSRSPSVHDTDAVLGTFDRGPDFAEKRADAEPSADESDDDGHAAARRKSKAKAAARKRQTAKSSDPLDGMWHPGRVYGASHTCNFHLHKWEAEDGVGAEGCSSGAQAAVCRGQGAAQPDEKDYCSAQKQRYAALGDQLCRSAEAEVPVMQVSKLPAEVVRPYISSGGMQGEMPLVGKHCVQTLRDLRAHCAELAYVTLDETATSIRALWPTQKQVCSRCVPRAPTAAEWRTRDGKPIRVHDYRESSEYQTRTEGRPQLWRVTAHLQEGGELEEGKVLITCNPTAAVHRAVGQLPTWRLEAALAAAANAGEPLDAVLAQHAAAVEWNLLDSQAHSTQMFRWRLGSNEADKETETPALLRAQSQELWPTQKRALTWMLGVENGLSFTERELAEEQGPPPLSCTLQGLAQRKALGTGGLNADALGSGKTVTALALVAHQLQKDRAARKGKEQLMGTLVLVPGYLVAQWCNETAAFCKAQVRQPGQKSAAKLPEDAAPDQIRVLRISGWGDFSHCGSHDFENADLIVCTNVLLKDPEYRKRHQQLGSVPQHRNAQKDDIRGTLIPGHPADPYKGLKEKAGVRDEAAHFHMKHMESVHRQRKELSHKRLLLEQFTYQRLIIDEGDRVMSVTKSREDIAARELIGVAEQDPNKRPIVAHRTWALTATPQPSDTHVAEFAALTSSVHVCGSGRHWATLERAADRDVFVENQKALPSAWALEFNRNHSQQWLDIFARRNKVQVGVKLTEERHAVLMTGSEQKDLAEALIGLARDGKGGFNMDPFDVADARRMPGINACGNIAARKAKARQIAEETQGKLLVLSPSEASGSGSTFAAAREAFDGMDGFVALTDMPDDQRGDTLALFGTPGKGPRILLLDFEQAAGANLQKDCNTMILFAPLCMEDKAATGARVVQAVGRLYRHGQTKDVIVHRLVAFATDKSGNQVDTVDSTLAHFNPLQDTDAQRRSGDAPGV